MKIGLLLPANLYFCPYAKIYTDFLDENSIKYDIIAWDKVGKNENTTYAYKNKIKSSDNYFIKLIKYYKYCNFIKSCVNKNKYNFLIVFGPQIGILSYRMLVGKYKNKFILDYRDLSIEQKCKYLYKKLLDCSTLNVISSPGFISCLPKQEYIISHNFDNKIALENRLIPFNGLFIKNHKYIILTIGAIRDYEQNIELVNSLANNENFQINFVGKSDTSRDIQNYTQNAKINNVSFWGYYNKSEEGDFIKEATFLNIYYPRKMSHDTALSNRFYNALFYYKPMIVTKNTIQGDLVEKYNLGIAIDDCNGLSEKIIEYVNNFDVKKYLEGRNKLIDLFLKEQDVFINSLKHIMINYK